MAAAPWKKAECMGPVRRFLAVAACASLGAFAAGAGVADEVEEAYQEALEGSVVVANVDVKVMELRRRTGSLTSCLEGFG